MTYTFDLYHAHEKINLKKVSVDSCCISVVTENGHGLASVAVIGRMPKKLAKSQSNSMTYNLLFNLLI